MTQQNNGCYRSQRKPSKSFNSRAEYLEHELTIMNPKRWGVNLPFRDYHFEMEDFVPALAATIGKIVMVAAVVAAFASPLGLSSEFVIENVRFEMLIAALLFVILFSGIFNPNANLAGTHGPMIPLIVASGGHPMALGIMVGLFGLFLSITKGGSKLMVLTGEGVRGGLLIYLGAVGMISQVKALFDWANGMDLAVWPPVLRVALLVGVFLPLLEAGMQMTRDSKTSQSAGIWLVLYYAAG